MKGKKLNFSVTIFMFTYLEMIIIETFARDNEANNTFSMGKQSQI